MVNKFISIKDGSDFFKLIQNTVDCLPYTNTDGNFPSAKNGGSVPSANTKQSILDLVNLDFYFIDSTKYYFSKSPILDSINIDTIFKEAIDSTGSFLLPTEGEANSVSPISNYSKSPVFESYILNNTNLMDVFSIAMNSTARTTLVTTLDL
jgi:hypothetical protein